MDPKEEGYKDSPTSSSGFEGLTQTGASSSTQVDPELIGFSHIQSGLSEPLLGAQSFSSEGFFIDTSAGYSMEDIGLSGSLPSSTFASPSMELEAFSIPLPATPSSSSPQMFELNASSTTSTVPTSAREVMEHIDAPQPLECLLGNPIPPFLSKTFDLVDDQSLDPIISWGAVGQSFVVWDSVEFARLILPRNFKHNNFSSFVRQLNTYGFRKIDTDRWEFANEAFQRGKRHLLKNIQRRKSPQSHQIGSTIGSASGAGKSLMQTEVQKLRNERSMLMQEVVELQQQHCGTVQHVGVVNQRLQSAEQRQKQMVSFLAKLFQNPAFLDHLRQKKEQRKLECPRVLRKFVKQHHHDTGISSSSKEGQIVKYRPEMDLFSIEQPPQCVSEELLERRGSDMESIAFKGDIVEPDELAVANEFIQSPERLADDLTSLGTDEALKVKNFMGPGQVNPEYFVSFPEDLAKEKSILEHSTPGAESIIKQEEMWNLGFNASVGASSSINELWGNPTGFEMLDFGVSGGFSDIWDLSSVPAVGNTGMDRWPTNENLFDEKDGQSEKLPDYSHTDKDIDP